MDESILARDWSEFLRQRGHRVRPLPGSSEILLSRAENGAHYRWILLESDRAIRRLTGIEHEKIRRELDRGQMRGELIFVVVHFEKPTERVLVIPGERALRTAKLNSDKGGIDWDR